MSEYYCTSKDMTKVKTPKKILEAGMWIEYNPNIKMYRINGQGGVDDELMGYTPHKFVLIDSVLKHVRRI